MNPPNADANVVLIGMPGAGKSTLGVLLAKLLSRDFLDTDLLIQASAGCRLQEIIAREGADAFRALEEETICDLAVRRHVIATGGSVVYSDQAMRHLQAHGFVVWLRLPVTTLRLRLDNLTTRGVVMTPGQSLDDLATERHPLYERYADAIIDCDDHGHEALVAAIAERLPPPLQPHTP